MGRLLKAWLKDVGLRSHRQDTSGKWVNASSPCVSLWLLRAGDELQARLRVNHRRRSKLAKSFNWFRLHTYDFGKTVLHITRKHAQVDEVFVKFFNTARLWRPALCVTVFGLSGICSMAAARAVLDNTALLGMSSSELASRLPPLQSVRAPRRLSSGAVGVLRVPDAPYDGLRFEQTLYMSHHRLQQTDLVMASPEPGQVAALVQSLRTRLGAGLDSSFSTPDAVVETATWVSGDADVMLFYSVQPGRPQARLVIRQRQLRDAGEL